MTSLLHHCVSQRRRERLAAAAGVVWSFEYRAGGWAEDQTSRSEALSTLEGRLSLLKERADSLEVIAGPARLRLRLHFGLELIVE